jgi:hypothetical protein
MDVHEGIIPFMQDPSMKALLLRYATPFTTGLFMVSLVSGVLIFFHLGGGAFKGMHEWLSMVLILPFILHLWRNWRPLVSYFRHLPMAIALVLSLVAAGAFFLPAGSGAGGPPQLVFLHRILDNKVSDIAPLVGETPEALTARLNAAGYTAAPDAVLSDVQARAGKSDVELIGVLMPKP